MLKITVNPLVPFIVYTAAFAISACTTVNTPTFPTATIASQVEYIPAPFEGLVMPSVPRHITQEEFLAANPGENCSFPQSPYKKAEIWIQEFYSQEQDGSYTFQGAAISPETSQILFGLHSENGLIIGQFNGENIIQDSPYVFRINSDPPLQALFISNKGLPIVCIGQQITDNKVVPILLQAVVDRFTLTIISDGNSP